MMAAWKNQYGAVRWHRKRLHARLASAHCTAEGAEESKSAHCGRPIFREEF